MKDIDLSKYKTPRIRHHSNRTFYFGANEHTKDLKFYPRVHDKIDWKNIFSNGLPPNCLDIGTGLGKFLLRYALNNPSENILGLEVRNIAVEWINDIIKNENLRNAHVLWYSTANMLPFIDDNSLGKIFCTFPDPWVKRRHNKRRVLNDEFLNEIFRVLKSGGNLYIMSDVDELTEYHIELLERSGKFSFKKVGEYEWDLNIKSNQEEFCLSKGIPYKRIVCKKIEC